MIAAAVASVVLLGSALVTSVYSVIFVMASDPCGAEGEGLICTTTGQMIAFWVPFAGASLATLVALAGAWIWPRRGRLVWLAGGLGGVLVAFLVGLSIALTGP